ncbi:Protein of unknown function [Stigmatella erecta]|uniref:DUF998 domain-containing protein n=2 Tax=Stigmatella erecta TaxID=83460 RepID=A0A1I0KVN8_9BACT|nr:Protein of unknown function [Stigmatella erecta]
MTGIGGPLAVLLLTVLGGAAFPDYSHLSQFISELGAREAPHGELISYGGFLPAGILICAFSFLAARVLPRSGMTWLGLVGIAWYAVGYVVSAFFRCDPGCRPAEPSFSQQVHNLVGVTGYFTGPVGLIVLGLRARSWSGARHLSALGVGCGGISLVALLLLSPSFPYVGAAQRVLEACVLLWIVVCAFYLKRSARAGT